MGKLGIGQDHATPEKDIEAIVTTAIPVLDTTRTSRKTDQLQAQPQQRQSNILDAISEVTLDESYCGFEPDQSAGIEVKGNLRKHLEFWNT